MAEDARCPSNKKQLKDVRANCFCSSLLRTQIHMHVIHRARAPATTTTFIYTILVEEKKGGKETKYRKQIMEDL